MVQCSQNLGPSPFGVAFAPLHHPVMPFSECLGGDVADGSTRIACDGRLGQRAVRGTDFPEGVDRRVANAHRSVKGLQGGKRRFRIRLYGVFNRPFTPVSRPLAVARFRFDGGLVAIKRGPLLV